MYTQRILEIIGSIKKQKDDIDKILKDTRQVQKEITLTSGKLERCYTVVDELIFKVGSVIFLVVSLVHD